jgi:hypothetical protein
MSLLYFFFFIVTPIIITSVGIGNGESGDALLQEIVNTATKLTAGNGAGQVGPLIDSIAKERYRAK